MSSYPLDQITFSTDTLGDADLKRLVVMYHEASMGDGAPGVRAFCQRLAVELREVVRRRERALLLLDAAAQEEDEAAEGSLVPPGGMGEVVARAQEELRDCARRAAEEAALWE